MVLSNFITNARKINSVHDLLRVLSRSKEYKYVGDEEDYTIGYPHTETYLSQGW